MNNILVVTLANDKRRMVFKQFDLDRVHIQASTHGKCWTVAKVSSLLTGTELMERIGDVLNISIQAVPNTTNH